MQKEDAEDDPSRGFGMLAIVLITAIILIVGGSISAYRSLTAPKVDSLDISTHRQNPFREAELIHEKIEERHSDIDIVLRGDDDLEEKIFASST